MKLLRTSLEVWLDHDIPELRSVKTRDKQMQRIAKVYNWTRALGLAVPDLARLDAELEAMVIEAKERKEHEWREAYEAALERCIDAAKVSGLNSKLMAVYVGYERIKEKTAFEYKDGILMGPHYRDWMLQAHEIMRDTSMVAPDELEIGVPKSTKEFFDLLLDEAELESVK